MTSDKCKETINSIILCYTDSGMGYRTQARIRVFNSSRLYL